jgi:hypothetical protein
MLSYAVLLLSLSVCGKKTLAEGTESGTLSLSRSLKQA